MADGKWVTVPANKTLSGRAERRWMQPSGELMTNEPGPGFVQARAAQALQGLGFLGNQIEQGLNRASGYQPQGLQLGRYARGDEQVAFKWDVPPAPAVKPPVGNPSPALSDDADARASEARRMLQQATPYWEREENKGLLQAAQVGGGPRAGEAGYAQRADIQAWMEAQRAKGPAGEAMVNRFLEGQKNRGLLDSPSTPPGLGNERIAMPTDVESATQAAQRGLAGFEGNALQQAQENVAAIQERERSAMHQKIWQAAAAGELNYPVAETALKEAPEWAKTAQATVNPASFTGLDVGRPFVDPEFNRRYASLSQPTGVQSIATGTGATLQPASAAPSETGVEPSQSDAPGNAVNPADVLAMRHLNRARTRADRYGF